MSSAYSNQQTALWKLCMLGFRLLGALLGITAALTFNLHEVLVVINPRWDICLGIAALLMPKGCILHRDKSKDTQAHSTSGAPQSIAPSCKDCSVDETTTPVAAQDMPGGGEMNYGVPSHQKQKSAFASGPAAGTPVTGTPPLKKRNNKIQKFFHSFRFNRRAGKQREAARAPAVPALAHQKADDVEDLFEQAWGISRGK